MAKLSKLSVAGTALIATAGGLSTLSNGLTITAHASVKKQASNSKASPMLNLKKASNKLDTASNKQAQMVNALLESKVDAQVPTKPGTYTKSVALLDESGKQLGVATLTRVVNADGSSQSTLSKSIPGGYTLKDTSVLNHYPSAITLSRVAGSVQAGTTTKQVKLVLANGQQIGTGTEIRTVASDGGATVKLNGIPQGYHVDNMDSLKSFPDQVVLAKGNPVNKQNAQNVSNTDTVDPSIVKGTDKPLTDGQQGKITPAQGQQGTTQNQGTATNAGQNKGTITLTPGNSQTNNAQQGQGSNTTAGTSANTNASKDTSGNSAGASKQGDASKGSATNTKTDTSKSTDTAKADTSKGSASKDTKADTPKATASTDKKDDSAKQDASKTDTAKTDASKGATTTDTKGNTSSKLADAVKSADSVIKSSARVDAGKSQDTGKSTDTSKKDESAKKSDSDKKHNTKSDDKKDGKLDLSDTTKALKKSSRNKDDSKSAPDDKSKGGSANKSNDKKDNVDNLLNSRSKKNKSADSAKVDNADVQTD